MACGMKAENDLGTRGVFDAEALDADRHATIGADSEGGANTPNIRPPRAGGGWAEDRAFFFLGKIPGPLRGEAQFPMSLMGVAVNPQSIDVWVGHFDLGNLFAGEIGRKSALPELVLALDFTFGLGCWGIKEANVVELERPAELGERLGILREKYSVIIDVDLEWPSVAQKSSGEEIEVGEEKFSIIEFRTDEETAAIVEHIEHGKVQRGRWKPAMRRSVQLPEFTDLGTLPAPDWGMVPFRWGRMRETIFNRPVADLGAVELEGVQAQGFRGREAVRARRGATEPFFEEVGDRFGPGGGVVAARGSRDPQSFFLSSAGTEVLGGECIKTAAG